MAARPRRILVGFDGSDASRRALDAAADLVGYGSTLSVACVANGHPAEAALDEARELLLRRQVSARYLQPVGEPAEALAEAASELDADLLVVGRRSEGSLQRLLLGSVSRKVVRRAPCDVLVVR